MRMVSPPVIRLDTDPARRRRYPNQIWVDNTLIELRPDFVGGERMVGTVLDNPAWSGTLPDHGPLLLGLDVLARLVESDHTRAGDSQQWLPLLPIEFNTDLEVARQRIAAGDIGAPGLVEITIPMGFPPADDWDVDYFAALSRLEALVFGLRAAEFVTGSTVESSEWLRAHPPVLAALHRLSGNVSLVHRIIPADCAPLTAFEGDVIGEAGRIVLRREFAPGAIGLWRRSQPGYTFAGVPEPKPDVQAPDSSPGGWELASLLRSLLADSDHVVGLREHAVRLVRHSVRLLKEAHNEHHRGTRPTSDQRD